MLNRNHHGSISCNTLAAGYEDHAGLNIGFGGESGIGSPGCTANYKSIGRSCIYFPIQGPESQDQMRAICKENAGPESAPYKPLDTVQNEVFRGFLLTLNVSV